MRRFPAYLASGGLLLLLSGCDLISGPGDCQAVGLASLHIRVRDQDGRPALRGSTIRVYNSGDEHLITRYPDPLTLNLHWGNRAGRFLVVVEKPWYRTFADPLVRVPGNECGVLRDGAVAVEATVVLLPEAPPVRHLEIWPPYRPPESPLPVSPCTRVYSLETYMDTAPSVSQEVTWTVRDPEIASVTGTGTITGACGAGGSTYVIAASFVDPSVRDSIFVAVAPAP